MPSAASAKLEKQASGNQTECSDNNNANTPIRQALVIIEHKIRNLEKRKTKLESYRADQLSGKELSNDQKIAVSKFDEVAQSLEFARELSKQMLQLATAAEKEQKKQARREALLRTQAETVKIREVLIIQNILSTFLSDQQIREDFLNGTNGAAKLEEDDLNILEKFHLDVQVKRQKTPEDVPFSVGAQKAAEYLSLTIDGRPKQYGETTFDNVRRILTIIQESGYLDKNGKISEGGGSSSDSGPVDESPGAENEQNDNQVLEDDEAVVATTIQDNVENIDAVNSNMPKQQQLQQPLQSQQQQLPPPQQSIQPSPPQNIGQQIIEAPSAAAVPAPSFPQQPQQQQQPPPQPTLVNTQIPSQAPPQMTIPVVQTQIVSASVAQAPQVAQGPPTVVQPNPASVNPLHAGHFPPTTVRAVEQAYFKQHQYIQQMRPLAEVIGSGNFFFLQDSELDSPDLVPTGGFTPNEGQNQNQSSIPTAPTSSSTITIPSNQPTIPQQQTQTQSQQQQAQQSQLSTMQPQPGGIPQQQQQQQKSQQAPPPSASAPIPTQTFTNQSFPPIVPPPNAAIFPPQAVQNPNEIPSSQPQMPTVFTNPPLPIQMVTPAGVATIQQQSIVVSVPAPSVVTAAGIVGSVQNSATVLKSIENQQQHQGIIAAQQQALMTGPSGANVPLAGFTTAVPTKFPPAPTPPMTGIHQDNYEKLQKQSQKNVLNESQIHHKKIDDIIVKDRNDVQNEWNTNENLPKQQRMPKKEEESNQWSNEMANVKSNEWNNTTYDSHQTAESNNWNSNSNQNESGGGGGYGSRGRNNNFGNRTGGGGGGNRGMRGNGSGGNNGGGPSSGGPPSNGYRGGGRSNNYQQQQQQSNHRNSGMYFRNNESAGSGNSGSGYYQNHQNGGYNSGPSGKQDSGNSNYAGGNINTSYRPRGGPMPSNRQQSAGGNSGGTRSSGGAASNSGGPQPQRNSMNANRPPNAAGMSVNTNRPGGGGGPRAAGNYGTSRPPPNVRQHQHQPQQDVNV